MAAFDAICSAQKDRRLGASDLTLPYNAINQQRQERPRYLSKTNRTREADHCPAGAGSTGQSKQHAGSAAG